MTTSSPVRKSNPCPAPRKRAAIQNRRTLRTLLIQDIWSLGTCGVAYSTCMHFGLQAHFRFQTAVIRAVSVATRNLSTDIVYSLLEPHRVSTKRYGAPRRSLTTVVVLSEMLCLLRIIESGLLRNVCGNSLTVHSTKPQSRPLSWDMSGMNSTICRLHSKRL